VGAIIPILLLIVDPVVFRNGGCFIGPVTPADYATFAYFAIGLGILALIGWLFVGTLRQHYPALLAGTLLTGGLFAAGMGIVMLPVTFLGLVICVGALGFFPFLTAFVYLRNGLRAFRVSVSGPASQVRLVAMLILGSLLVLGIPALAQALVSSAIQRPIDVIVRNPGASTETAAVVDLNRIRNVCLTLCTGNIASAFMRAQGEHPDQQQRLADIYQRITGEYLNKDFCRTNSNSE
jgi:hypothetical protein